MMLTHKKTNSASWLKLLVMLPIVGVALALNAETVNDYVYAEKPQPQQKKVVKKGRKDGQIKLNNQTVELKTDTASYKGVNVNIELDTDHLKSPLVVVDGKPVEDPDKFMRDLDPATIDHIEVLKSEELKELYSKIYNADAKEGVIVITTKAHAAKHQDKQEKEVAEVSGDAQDPEGAFDVVEQMPEFPGGAGEMMKFIATTVKYPEAAMKSGKQGRVIATFIVEADGTVSNIKVVKSVSEELDAEAVRVIELMPKWTPGKQNGKEVRVKYTIPVSFRLS